MTLQDEKPYGWRARIGLVVPATNIVNEAEWRRFMPDGVSFHTSRVPLHPPSQSKAEIDALVQDVAASARLAMAAKVKVIAYACTADSMIAPPHAFANRLSAALDTPVITTAQALVEGLKALGASRICIATPFLDARDTLEEHFFSATGFEVAGVKGLGIPFAEHDRVPLLPLETIRHHALNSFIPGTDALILTCTDVPCTGLIGQLEREIRVPVLTSNQATLWLALRRAGLSDCPPELGALFRCV